MGQQNNLKIKTKEDSLFIHKCYVKYKINIKISEKHRTCTTRNNQVEADIDNFDHVVLLLI